MGYARILREILRGRGLFPNANQSENHYKYSDRNEIGKGLYGVKALFQKSLT